MCLLQGVQHLQERLSLMEAESLIAESYQVVNGVDSEPSAEHVGKWCMQDSAAVRQVWPLALGGKLYNTSRASDSGGHHCSRAAQPSDNALKQHVIDDVGPKIQDWYSVLLLTHSSLLLFRRPFSGWPAC